MSTVVDIDVLGIKTGSYLFLVRYEYDIEEALTLELVDARRDVYASASEMSLIKS